MHNILKALFGISCQKSHLKEVRMIVELVVKNFRSIKNEQTFSMAKSKSIELEDNTFVPNAAGAIPLLRSSALYGANAAGKSNLIRSLKTMREVVRESAKERQRGDSLSVVPFKLSDETVNAPSEFEVVFFADGIKYQYGFTLTHERIHEEWLYAFPNERPQRWFIRAYDVETNEYAWDFSASFTGKKQLWKEATRDNSLFLSTAVMLNSDKLKPVYDWFDKTLKVTGIDGWSHGYTADMCSEEHGKREILKFLKAADLNISDVVVESKSIDGSFFPESMPNSIRDELLKELAGKELLEVKTVHKSDSGKDVLFDLQDESDGTRKLFSFAGPWVDSLKSGNVLFIDELHDSLHPNIVKFLVRLFNNPQTNPNNAQLVFTTHETSILDQNIFRRDQVWFCSKNDRQETVLYPLTDFNPRKGVENLEKSYLSGRYGALPMVSTLDYMGDNPHGL